VREFAVPAQSVVPDGFNLSDLVVDNAIRAPHRVQFRRLRGEHWLLQKGPGKPRASRQITRQRSSSRKMFSSRLRRVTRGGTGLRNISELNGICSFDVRRMR